THYPICHSEIENSNSQPPGLVCTSVSDDEDDTEAALAELERMKKDKAEDKEKQEQEEQLKAEEESQLFKGNPLLDNNNNPTSFGVKRRWDDDVPFKNQARGETKLQKRSINDTMRNDFAKKFLQRHMK
ncbi:Pre-mRNA-splicing factor Cwf15/Cwc15, partial [Corchorus capsularis]